MPKISLSEKQKTLLFANALKEFLPKNLTLESDLFGCPILCQRGWGFLKGTVGYMSSHSIIIKRKEWKDNLIKAIAQYEEKNHKTIEVLLDFDQH
jgi:hypothetical protein